MSHEMRDSSGRPVAIDIDVRTKCSPQPLPRPHWEFPDPRRAASHGLIGEGGDFTPPTIIAAYRAGIFPWPHPESEMVWFSPDPRAIIPVGGLHISRRLARTIRAGDFRVSIDGAFERVMTACAEEHEGGTWITPRLVEGYCELHEFGWAHSVEVWNAAGLLVGGLYGVGLGAMFGAESMFHRERDASKVAMVGLFQHAVRIGLRLIDIQVLTDHTQAMGGIEISRDDYLEQLRTAAGAIVDWRA